MTRLNKFYNAAIAIIYLFIGFRIVQLAVSLFTIVSVKMAIAGEGSEWSLQLIDATMAMEGNVGVAIYLALACTFVGWLYLSYKKAQEGSFATFSYRPGFALVAFIVPIFNLFAPYKIMREIWQAENKTAQEAARIEKAINVWWMLGLIIFVYSRYINFTFNNIDDLLQLVTASYYNLVLYGISIHYLVTLKTLVAEVNKQQNLPGSGLGFAGMDENRG